MKLFVSINVHETGEALGMQRISFLNCVFSAMMYQKR